MLGEDRASFMSDPVSAMTHPEVQSAPVTTFAPPSPAATQGRVRSRSFLSAIRRLPPSRQERPQGLCNAGENNRANDQR